MTSKQIIIQTLPTQRCMVCFFDKLMADHIPLRELESMRELELNKFLVISNW